MDGDGVGSQVLVASGSRRRLGTGSPGLNGGVLGCTSVRCSCRRFYDARMREDLTLYKAVT